MEMEMESTKNSSEIVIIDYSELVEFCVDSNVSSSTSLSTGIAIQQKQKKQVLIQKIEQAFGPYGLGIVVISNVPNVNEQRQKLLPLGAKIPNLPNINETLVDPASYYSVGWSHGKEQLGGGKCDYLKGSYYANPLTDDIVSSILHREDVCNMEKEIYLRDQAKLHPEFYAPNIWPDTTTLPEFKERFCQLGQTIVHVGCMVAEVCDAYCSNHVDNNNNNNDTTGITLNLATTIRQSLNCKGRLLHYFAPNSINDDESTTTRDNQTSSVSSTIETPVQQETSHNNLWCAWHNDHGSLTGLVPALYLDHNCNEVPCPDNQTGLYIQPRQRNGITIDPIRVQVPTHAGTSYILYQIGETSQIQSGGLLQATPHAVIFGNTTTGSTSTIGTNRLITRESFAVFMEPEFDTVLKSPSISTILPSSPSPSPTLPFLPSLQQRWKPGQSFGDFHLATVSAFTTG